MSEVKKINVKLHVGQLRIINERRRFNVVACGRRFGKTRLALTLAFESIVKKQPCVYITPTAADYEKRWREAVWSYGRLIKEIIKSEGSLIFHNGARMDFYGMHRYDAARGNKYGRVIFDEAAHSDNLADAWSEVFRPTLVDYKGDAYFFSTPNFAQQPNAFKRFFETQHPDWMRWQMPSTTNPFIAAEEIEDARKDPNTPEIKFRQEYLAEFVDASGTLVSRDYIKYHAVQPEGLMYGMGVDLAISQKAHADYSAIIVVGLASDGRIFVVDSWRGHTSFHETQEKIKSLAAKWNPSMIQIESVQYQAAMVQELVRTTTLPVRAAETSRDKVTRFMPVLGKLEHGLLSFRHGMDDLVNELIAFPLGVNDDMVDALVYACRATERGFWFG